MKTSVANPNKLYDSFIENAGQLYIKRDFCDPRWDCIVEPKEFWVEAAFDESEENFNTFCAKKFANKDRVDLSFMHLGLSNTNRDIMYSGIADSYIYSGTPVASETEWLCPGEWSMEARCPGNCIPLKHTYSEKPTLCVTGSCTGKLTEGTHYNLFQDKITCKWFVQFLSSGFPGWEDDLKQLIALQHSWERWEGWAYVPNDCDYGNPFVATYVQYTSRCAGGTPMKLITTFYDIVAKPLAWKPPVKWGDAATTYEVSWSGRILDMQYKPAITL